MPSLYDLLMQREMSDKTGRAAATMASEMPVESAQANVGDSGWIGRFQNALGGLVGGGKVYANTNPFTGSVSMNAGNMADLPQEEVNDILAHELIHTRQIKAMSPLERVGNFGKAIYTNLTSGPEGSPQEREAYAFSNNRATKRTDYILPRSGLRK